MKKVIGMRIRWGFVIYQVDQENNRKTFPKSYEKELLVSIGWGRNNTTSQRDRNSFSLRFLGLNLASLKRTATVFKKFISMKKKLIEKSKHSFRKCSPLLRSLQLISSEFFKSKINFKLYLTLFNN